MGNLTFNVVLEHSSKSTKYELEGSYNNLQLTTIWLMRFLLTTAKLPRDCNEVPVLPPLAVYDTRPRL